MPARPRLASTIRRSPTGCGGGHQVEVADGVARADEQQPAGRVRGVDGGGDLVRREPGLVGHEARRCGPRAPGRPRATPRARRRRASGDWAPRRTRARAETGCARSGQRPRARTETTSTSGRDSSRATGRDRVGWPKTTTRSMRCAQLGAEEQPVGADRVGAGARPAARLGEQRPPGLLGQLPGRRTRVVTRRPRPSAARARGGAGCRPPPSPRIVRRRSDPLVRRVGGPNALGLSSVGSSGSSNWQFRWIGPSGSQAASRASSAGSVRSTKLAASPKRRTWSVVWLAPVPRRRAGRSAVTATRGTPAWAASSTAGCRLAVAVPEVVTTATGRCDPLARPRARKPAVRSSMRVCSLTPLVGGQGEGQRGVARPRAEHDVGHPAPTSSSTTQVASAEDAFTSDDPAARPRPRRSGGPSAPRGRGRRGDPVQRRRRRPPAGGRAGTRRPGAGARPPRRR